MSLWRQAPLIRRYNIRQLPPLRWQKSEIGYDILILEEKRIEQRD